MLADQPKSSWGGKRLGAGRPTEPGSRRRRRRAPKIACAELIERIAFVHDTAGDVAKDNVKNWKSWRGSPELHAYALQQDLDDIVLRLDALIRGDAGPFEGPEFREWRAKRDRCAVARTQAMDIE